MKYILDNNSEKAKQKGCVEKEPEAQGKSLRVEKYDSAVKKCWAGIGIWSISGQYSLPFHRGIATSKQTALMDPITVS